MLTHSTAAACQIPANCEKTSNVCDPSCDYDYRCAHIHTHSSAGAWRCLTRCGDGSTANFNNYIYTNDGGEGIACACVRAVARVWVQPCHSVVVQTRTCASR